MESGSKREKNAGSGGSSRRREKVKGEKNAGSRGSRRRRERVKGEKDAGSRGVGAGRRE